MERIGRDGRDDRGYAEARRTAPVARAGPAPYPAARGFPVSTFMAQHIAQEVLPRPGIHLDPQLYGHPGLAAYRAAQDALTARPTTVSLNA